MGTASLAGRTVLVTGTGPGLGIGRELTFGFARNGANLVLNHHGQDPAGLTTFLGELRAFDVRVVAREGDISSEETVAELVDAAVAEFGGIDVLVNSAGISSLSDVQDMRKEMWDRMIAVNLTSVFLTTRAVVPHMVRNGFGRIVNIASQLGQKGGVRHSHYAAAKAGVIGFTKSVALELGDKGVTANCIAPGPVETQLMATVPEEWKDSKRAELAIPRFGTPEEVVPTALFLASEPEGNLYTGQTLGPNCGDVMM